MDTEKEESALRAPFLGLCETSVFSVVKKATSSGSRSLSSGLPSAGPVGSPPP